MTETEVSRLFFLAWWSFAHGAVGALIYRWLTGVWIWNDIPRTIENIVAVWHHLRNPPEMPELEQDQGKKRVHQEYDYWEEEVDYATGEIITDSGPAIRHPKNRDRAYEGSAERFHDGSW